MKNIVVIANPSKDVALELTDRVIKTLYESGMQVYISGDCNYDSEYITKYTDFPENADLIVVVGGDGSVIDASKYAIEHEIPMLGVNLGKVGYLAEVEQDDLSVLFRLNEGRYKISDKMLLEAEFGTSEKSVLTCAVNDIVVSHDTHLGISDFKVEDSVGNTVRYRADGVIFSTPQGSTAYSLSAGGPILAHDVESILMTPVSPHSFFNRSVLFNSSECIKVTNTSDTPMAISIDGRLRGVLHTGEICAVRKSSKAVKMLTFSENSMFSSLFKKMRIIGDMD